MWFRLCAPNLRAPIKLTVKDKVNQRVSQRKGKQQQTAAKALKDVKFL
jgi:hypothetical protein